MKKYKILIDSVMWGCLSNFINCSKQYNYFIKNGHSITYNISEADFIIINSCGTLKTNEESSIKRFYEYHSKKKKNTKIIMTGCLIKINEEIFEKMDLITIGLYEGYKFDEIFYNNYKYEDIGPICDENTKNILLNDVKLDVTDEKISTFLPKLFNTLTKKSRNNFYKWKKEKRSFIEIGFGCTGNCSYCVIKKAKGKAKSIDQGKIINDISKLYPESKKLFLISEDCGCYGVDTNSNLSNLVLEIKKRFPDITIFLEYIDPYWLQKSPDEYIKLFKEVNIKTAIIPLQSGSNKIIKNMNRRYDVKKVLKIIKEIKRVSPNTLIYSQFIVGFPGENTLDFIKTLFSMFNYDYNMVNVYSDRIGAKSSSLSNKKTNFTKNLRRLIFIFPMYMINTTKLLRNKELFHTHVNRFYFIYK